jgi:hypothetical protein
MDKELTAYYENLLDLFTRDGWNQFIEDLSDNAEMLSDITTIKDEKDFWYRRGQLEALQRILSYESTIKDSYEDFEREFNAEANI